MSIKLKDTNELKDWKEHVESNDDPRWQLVERIINSTSFSKTERLSSFLRCICQLVQTDQIHNINEQHIGAAVFGRNADYDPAIDSIVRSHASRLRHRLQQYFSGEGADEELVLTIPKGGYIPVFQSRLNPIEQSEVVADIPVLYPKLIRDGVETSDEPGVAPLVFREEAIATPIQSKGLVMGLIGALVISLLLAGTAVGILLMDRRHTRSSSANVSESVALFWGSIFNARERTIVVNADSGAVMLQNLTKRRVSLDTYLSGDYLKNLSGSPYSAGMTHNLGTRRYTSIIDLTIMSRIFRMPGIDLEHTQFRYSRDLRLDEIKQCNLVLLGTYESTPWVQLFEPSMNFYFQNDLADGIFSIVNRDPQKGEQARYDSVASDPQHTVYGVIAYRPSLSGSGKVLILEGQSMAGTEAAADFVFDDGYLLPFLNSIRRPDGTIPFFELVLRSKSISVEASRLEKIAFRVENQ